jgi:hypothetical protein
MTDWGESIFLFPLLPALAFPLWVHAARTREMWVAVVVGGHTTTLVVSVFMPPPPPLHPRVTTTTPQATKGRENVQIVIFEAYFLVIY